MNYLENKRFIHRDLAARNILVFTKDKVCPLKQNLIADVIDIIMKVFIHEIWY